MKKLRVLFVASFCRMPDGGTGGQTTVALNVRNSQLAQFVDFVAVDSTMQTLPPPPSWRRAAGAARRVISFLRGLPPSDVVVIFASAGASLFEKGLMARVARLFHKGVVLRISSGRLPEQCDNNPRMRAWLRRALSNADVVISQGPYWTNYFNAYAQAEGKIIEVPNGVVVQGLPPRPLRRNTSPKVTYVGWMVPQKGIYKTLAVAKELRKAYPNLVLSMAGGGEMDGFRRAVDTEGMQDSVNILGWQSAQEVQSLLSSSDVFLLPSYYEGLPNALLEAMAAGVPVVATPVGCVADLIQTGRNGLLVPVGDIAATSAAVLSLLHDPEWARRIGEEGRRTVERLCDIRSIWKLYAEAISRAASQTGRAGLIVPPVIPVAAETSASLTVGRKN